MSEVIDRLIDKYPVYKDVDRNALIDAVGRKYPAYLEHADFKDEFDQLQTLNKSVQEGTAEVPTEPKPSAPLSGAFDQLFSKPIPEQAGVPDTTGSPLVQSTLDKTSESPLKVLSGAISQDIQTLRSIQDKPLVELPKPTINPDDSEHAKFLKGLGSSLVSGVEGLMTMRSAELAGAGVVMGPLAPYFFGALGVAGAAKGGYEMSQAKAPEERGAALGDTILNLGMAALAVKSGIGAKAPEALAPRTTEAATSVIKEGAQNASSITETTTLHGDLRPQPLKGAGEVPAAQGSEGVQPQSEGGLQNAPIGQEGIDFDKAQSDVAASFDKGRVEAGLPPPEDISLPGSTTKIKPELLMEVVPGTKSFVENDLLPKVSEGIAGIKQSAAEINEVLRPPNISVESKATSGILREKLAELAQKDVQARTALKQAKAEFDKAGPEAGLQFQYTMEEGGKQSTPELQHLADHLENAFEDRAEQVRQLGTGKLEQLVENYFPHLWSKPKEAQGILAQIFAKRPLRGPASFLKRRTIPTVREGIEAGLTPLSYNPIDQSLVKLHEMDKYVMGQKVINEMKESGLMKFIKASESLPDGYAKIDDRFSEVVQYRKSDEGPTERIIRGRWVAPIDAARVLNNYLSPGLNRFATFRALRWMGNALNQAQLGLSAYHLNFTAIDSATSKLALGIEKASRGNSEAGMDLAKSTIGNPALYAPIENYLRGDKVLKEYTKPGSVGGEYTKIADALIKAGGRVQMDAFYRNSTAANFMEAIRKGNYPGAILRAPFAALDAASKPIMETIVPRMKLGIFADMAKDILARLPEDTPKAKIREELGKAWDSVDNRMGQMVYDNLFWDKTLKDLAMVSVRSVGWNLGTLRELGGGVKDSATILKRLKAGDPVLTHRMAYLVSLPVTVGMIGAMYQYLHTGKGPQSLQDYFMPLTGKKNPDGSDERVIFPSYMKDILPLAKAAAHGPFKLITRLSEMVVNKAQPMFSAIGQMLRNKDFYGTQIRNVDDPIVQQSKQELEFVAKQFLPFSIRGAQRRQSERPEAKVESFAGIMPAPGELTRTDAEQKMYEIMKSKFAEGGVTPEARARSDIKKQIVDEQRKGKAMPELKSELDYFRKTGQLTKGQVGRTWSQMRFIDIESKKGHSPEEANKLWRFKALSVDEAQQVYKVANDNEKALFKPLMDRKLKASK